MEKKTHVECPFWGHDVTLVAWAVETVAARQAAMILVSEIDGGP